MACVTRISRSKDATAAQQLLAYVRFGLTHLPPWLALPIATEAGADTSTMLKLNAGPDDTRAIVSYAASPHAAIDQSATHSHVDELAHMTFADQTWNSIETTVASNGTCHIVTRGSGDAHYAAELWGLAQSGASRLRPFFEPWTARPGRDAEWRAGHEATLNMQGLLHFAPETPEDALAGDATAMYIPPAVWRRCHDPNLPPFVPEDRTPIVLGVDGSVTGDMFAVVAVTRHHERPDEAVIRATKMWDPREHGGEVPFDEIERWLMYVCDGGCRFGHPRALPDPLCEGCNARAFTRGYNVVCMVYDPHQVADMMQRPRRRGIAWVDGFEQGERSLVADAMLDKMALSGKLWHNGDAKLAEYVNPPGAEMMRGQVRPMDARMRIHRRWWGSSRASESGHD